MHYHRWQRHGDPLTITRVRAQGTLEDRFWAHVNRGTDEACWYWLASVTKYGYGRFCVNGLSRTAHRFAYELLVGPIPEGLMLDHLCRNRRCVNPAHLEPVTNWENLRRGIGFRLIGERFGKRTHCSQGHRYPQNVRRSARGARICQECQRAYNRAHYWRKRANASAVPA